MHERNPFALYDQEPPTVSNSSPMPDWLGRRLLRDGETLTWVRGPGWNPRIEWFLTSPVMFLAAFLLASVCVGAAWFAAGSFARTPIWSGIVALVLIFGSIFILGIFNAYFTRLVVTSERLFIVQGSAICKTWRIDQLPKSLIRYTARGPGEASRTVDLNALQTMLGGRSDQFVESKTILAFGKQLDRIRSLENDNRRMKDEG